MEIFPAISEKYKWKQTISQLKELITLFQWRRHMGALGARAPPEKLNCRNFEAD